MDGRADGRISAIFPLSLVVSLNKEKSDKIINKKIKKSKRIISRRIKGKSITAVRLIKSKNKYCSLSGKKKLILL